MQRHVSLSLFLNMKAICTSGTCYIDFSTSQAASELNTTAKSLHSITDMPRYVGFAHYDGKHDQSGLAQIDAVVLEYAATERSNLEAAVEARGWNALVFNTERKALNTVTAAIPFESPLRAEDDYTRAATLIARDLNVFNLLDGKANTFLVQPIQFARAAWFPGRTISPMFLGQIGWFEITDYMRPAPTSPTSAPQTATPTLASRWDEFFEKTDELEATAAQLVQIAKGLRPSTHNDNKR